MRELGFLIVEHWTVRGVDQVCAGIQALNLAQMVPLVQRLCASLKSEGLGFQSTDTLNRPHCGLTRLKLFSKIHPALELLSPTCVLSDLKVRYIQDLYSALHDQIPID